MAQPNSHGNVEGRGNSGTTENSRGHGYGRSGASQNMGDRARSESSGSSRPTSASTSGSTGIRSGSPSVSGFSTPGNRSTTTSLSLNDSRGGGGGGGGGRGKKSISSSTNVNNSNSGNQTSIPNFGNDYNDHYLHSGVLPQSHITNIEDPLVGYPKLQRLHTLKELHNRRYSSKPFGSRVSPKDMPNRIESWVNQGMNFDVVMINGCIENVPSYETLISLPIQKITPRPSIVFLWVPSPALEKGRLVLEHWGFRRSEDIVYLVTDTNSIHFPKWLAVSPQDSLIKTSWHCLMGLKGTLRRSEDSDLINCNVDTDVILESTVDRPNVVPEKIYRIVENFSLMSRRLHIIPTYSTLDKPVRIRQGWVMMSPDVMLDNFEPQSYMNQNTVAGYRVPVDEVINDLRPKTPPRSVRK